MKSQKSWMPSMFANLSLQHGFNLSCNDKRTNPNSVAVQAPAAGRLSAAMATIWARRRPIRDRTERSNELNRRMSQNSWRPEQSSLK